MIELMGADGVTLVSPVETALACGYSRPLNELGTATLSLALGDALTAQIDVPVSWLRLWDGEDFAGLYRFKSAVYDEQQEGATASYQLESAECTLMDDMLMGHHELGGTELDTAWVLRYILAHQSQARWVLGRCDFCDYYQYNFEDVTLLEAIMSLGEVLIEPYAFVFDASSVPWTVSLVRLSDRPVRSLVYGRSVSAIRRTVDGRVVTRLTGRGYGEGDNQLTVASINGGLDYIDADPETMDRYRVRAGMHVDLRQTDPATLLARMRAILEAGKRPRVSYEATCDDLYRLSGEPWDDAQPGDMVLVLDEDLRAPVTVCVTAREKPDLEGGPGDVRIRLDSSVRDTAEALNEILDRIGVQELYSQGATNLYSMQVSDNADEGHPLELSFYVPGNVLRINSCLLRFKLEPFRSYERLAASGGGGVRTSAAGGGATVTIPEMTLRLSYMSADAVDTDGESSARTTYPEDYSGDAKKSTGSAGEHAHNMTHTHAIGGHTHLFTGESVTYSIGHNHSLAGDGALATGGISSGNKSIKVTPKGTVEDVGTLWTDNPHASVSGEVIYATGKQGVHSHDMEHVHRMPHIHDITHQHVIPALTFELSPHTHTVSVPEHTHELEHGIYTGSRAGSVKISVDGEGIPPEELGDDREIDIARYLRKNDDGRVTRASWHSVAFAPDKLTRITANLFFQVFIQSRGAGDY